MYAFQWLQMKMACYFMALIIKYISGTQILKDQTPMMLLNTVAIKPGTYNLQVAIGKLIILFIILPPDEDQLISDFIVQVGSTLRVCYFSL